MSQNLPHDEIKLYENVSLEDILNTSDGSDKGYFIECYYHTLIKIKKTMNFLFFPQNKVSPQDKFTYYMKKKRNQKLILHVKAFL